jgi:hypothetical protein
MQHATRRQHTAVPCHAMHTHRVAYVCVPTRLLGPHGSDAATPRRAAPHARSVRAAAACCRDPRGQPTQARVLAGRLHRRRQVLRVRCAAERPTATAVEMVSGLVLGCDAVRMSIEMFCNTARHEAACCHTRACCIMARLGHHGANGHWPAAGRDALRSRVAVQMWAQSRGRCGQARPVAVQMWRRRGQCAQGRALLG